MPKKYALHPGHVTSKNDGDVHFIGGPQLARLYKLAPHEYIIWRDTGSGFWDDYIHLYPSYNGDYGRPDGKEEATCRETVASTEEPE